MADADLVLEGGGVKGMALIGAVAALERHGEPYTFHRVAGTSAGAIVAGLLAAGMSVAELRDTMERLDFSRFRDELGFWAHVPLVGPVASLLLHEGLYAGGFLHNWLAETLDGLGVTTWADLKEDDPGSALPLEQRYKLVVIVSDVSRGLMLRLPWDYQRLLGVDPDHELVADAIRASASIPFFYRPWKMLCDPLVAGHDHIVCVDGGLLSNYPLALFDRHDDAPARWPTLGVKLSGRPTLRAQDWRPNTNNVELAMSLLGALLEGHERSYVVEPQARARTIFVDTSGIRPTDFHLSREEKEALFQHGLRSGEKFLRRWDWERWKNGDYEAQP